MKRYLQEAIEGALQKKMAFVGGPRQCGKTFLAKTLLSEAGHKKPLYAGRYLNWDLASDRDLFLKGELNCSEGLVVLDEIHKYSRWRQYIKGHFDQRGPLLKLLVTGSARLDLYRRGGDSLQGRYRYFRLHPLSFKEIGGKTAADLHELLQFGGFPEPFLGKSLSEAKIWRRDYRSRLVYEDIRTLERIEELDLFERLLQMLPGRVGSPLSINALREDLGVAHKTVQRWILAMERTYSIFRVYPFGPPRARAVKKEAKHYHYDWANVDDAGARFENLIASHLLKWCQYLEDTTGDDVELRYFRDTTPREVDFVVLKDKKPVLLVEAKMSETEISPHLRYLKQKFPQARAVQVLHSDCPLRVTQEGIELISAQRFLPELA